jgi:hypothetical protein
LVWRFGGSRPYALEYDNFGNYKINGDGPGNIIEKNVLGQRGFPKDAPAGDTKDKAPGLVVLVEGVNAHVSRLRFRNQESHCGLIRVGGLWRPNALLLSAIARRTAARFERRGDCHSWRRRRPSGFFPAHGVRRGSEGSTGNYR